MRVTTIVLSAGQGTRMKSKTPKVLHPILGKPMVGHVLDQIRAVSEQVFVVVGHEGDTVRKAVEGMAGTLDLRVVWQKEQKGTGHAVKQVLPHLGNDASGYVLIVYGDTPLITAKLISDILKKVEGHELSLVSSVVKNPSGYGRLVRNQRGLLVRIVEEKDCTEEERALTEINAGIYVVSTTLLNHVIGGLGSHNAQGEIYLTDIVSEAAKRGKVQVVCAEPEEIFGVNDRVDLSRAEVLMRRRINQAHMQRGVTFVDPEHTFVDVDVTIGMDTILHPGVVLRGNTKIGARCTMDVGCVITNTTIGDDCILKPYTVATESHIEAEGQLGPFSHLRPETHVGARARIGNFVELKKTNIGLGSKVNHLSYLGDAEIGRDVNVGCGTITCNYDGYQKYRTIIEDGAFIGSDTQLVAPVRVGKDAVVGAGTTVTKDVPAGALALSRAPQTSKLGYREKKRTNRKPSD